MNRLQRFLGGVSFGYANLTLVTVAGLWLTPFFLRHLGEYDYGLWLLGLQLVSYLSLLDVGVVALLPRQTAYATGRAGDIQAAADLPEVIGQAFRIVLWQTPFVGLASLGVWVAIPEGWAALRGPLALILLAFTALFPTRALQAVLQGLQDLAFLGKAQLAVWALGTALTVGLVVSGFGLFSLAAGWIVSQGLAAVLWGIRLRRKFPSVFPPVLPRTDRTAALRYLQQSLWVSVAQVAQILLRGTELVVIGIALGPPAIVLYVCTAKLPAVLGHHPQLLMQSAAPALSELKAGAHTARLSSVSGGLTQATLLVSGLIVCLVLLVNEGFVNWWVGSAFYGGSTLTALLLAAMLLRHWNTAAVYSLFCFGYEKRISLTAVADGAITITASVVLVSVIGVAGAALGSIVGVCAVSLPLNLAALGRETGRPTLRVVSTLGPWAVRVVPLAVAAALIAVAWAPQGPIALVSAAAAAAAMYGLVMRPLLRKEPLGTYLGVIPVLRWAVGATHK